MSEAHHPIQLAARLTGLSTHVIRVAFRAISVDFFQGVSGGTWGW
jgi:hypothetical protein